MASDHRKACGSKCCIKVPGSIRGAEVEHSDIGGMSTAALTLTNAGMKIRKLQHRHNGAIGKPSTGVGKQHPMDEWRGFTGRGAAL
mmetsp:Transcript_31598/g.87170  ORF Transcript_31598/g.87170 Transcript_31598/m.87170 type:complete len:86 (-) Transcript_31598:32-289(-)